ncbi:MAG: hypothetical protein IJ730_04345 [Alphaproteobacteria bacterium]|nr:hypothetical protein [Alphaproteobacteria bacterium]
MIIEAKSKTFLVGEYCVMCGGPAILLCTDPQFQLLIQNNINNSDSIISGISKQSPTFEFYQANRNSFRNLSIKFIDPHKGMGGFGASSAQFVLIYKLYKQLQKQTKKSEIDSETEIDIAAFLETYRELFGQGHSIKPSGADCVAQIHNNHIYFNSSNNSVIHLNWNFKNIDFLIFRTGYKIATYKHLKNISPDFLYKNCDQLSKIVDKVFKAWISDEIYSFSKGIMEFFFTLDELNLVTTETKKLVEQILKIDGVLAAKGCGAMSADTIVVIFEKQSKNNIQKMIKNIIKIKAD